jgi:hypothetical protein
MCVFVKGKNRMRNLWNAIALLVIGVLLTHPAGISAQAVDPIEVVRNTSPPRTLAISTRRLLSTPMERS